MILPLGDDPKEKRNGLKAKQNGSFDQQGKVVTGLTGETVCIRRAPDLAAVRSALQASCSSSFLNNDNDTTVPLEIIMVSHTSSCRLFQQTS